MDTKLLFKIFPIVATCKMFIFHSVILLVVGEAVTLWGAC